MERENFCATIFDEMVEIYKTGDISALCLSLQQEFDADVPLFLICLMADRAGLGLDPAGFAAWLQASAAWRDEVIKPLRALRVRLKPKIADPQINDFRERIKSCELEAERLHVEHLAAEFLHGSGDGALARRYLLSLGLSAPQAGQRIDAIACRIAT
ncbi:TIGR02444 family protein [Mangrovicoccus algicola]|uniref:TIGR02444 family protein n=1 Tax=Mangrovicoccus algicola TaxID=2771008 RepID=A0A8J7CW32_9RHOB|nr:TIGR02444 family protein [Mangrovicoccus algicola]MBE3637257.1 TIGR02444 family protein [Mangrovicoccus algicola]